MSKYDKGEYKTPNDALTFKQKRWAYDMWCLGHTQEQIAEALGVCRKTIQRAVQGKPRIRPVLVYKE